MSSQTNTTLPARRPRWGDQGYSQAWLKTVREWCVGQNPGSFVLFSHGTAVYVTEQMVSLVRETEGGRTVSLPNIPAYRLPTDATSFMAIRNRFVSGKIASLTGRSQLLYMAAVHHLARVGYPVSGTSDSDSFIRLHGKTMWSSQYRNHDNIVTYVPKIDNATVGHAVQIISQFGSRLDQLALIPAYIHDSAEYDTAARKLDPNSWNPDSGNLDPETTGLSLISASPDATRVIQAVTGKEPALN